MKAERVTTPERQQQLAEARKFASPAPKGVSIGPGSTKVETLLTREHMSEYLTFLARADTTMPRARAWLKDRGYHMGARAVCRHRQKYRQTLKSVRQVAMLAHTMMHIARDFGTDVSEASVTFIEQQLMQSILQTVKAQTDGAFDAERWQPIVKTVGESLKNHALLSEMLQQQGITPKKPFDGKAVAAEFRRQLGIPPWKESKASPVPAEQTRQLPDPLA